MKLSEWEKRAILAGLLLVKENAEPDMCDIPLEALNVLTDGGRANIPHADRIEALWKRLADLDPAWVY